MEGILPALRTAISIFLKLAYQNDSATPNVHLPSGIEPICNNKFGRSIARTPTTCLHEVTHLPIVIRSDDIIILSDFLDVECIGEAEISNNDVPVLIQQKVFLMSKNC
jgi:hypothetical protein